VDPHGYRLADRIWQSGARARSRIDGVLEAGIARGASARAIAAELVPLTRPGSPSAVADTLRLARTEIARAYGQAQVAAALRNPFVLALRWTLAEGTHPRTDTCDALAGRYPVDAVPPFPGHPNCRCTLEPELTEATQAMIGRLDRWAQGRGPLPRASLSDIDAAALVDAIADMY
jgi:hypothetical protein